MSWWASPPPLFYAITAALGLTITQYLVWRASVVELKGKLEETRKKLRESNRKFRQAAESTAMEMQMGPTADLTAEQRFDNAKRHFARLEAEILAGDFSHAWEVPRFKELFIYELRVQFAGGIGFSDWYQRLVKVVDAVEFRTRRRRRDRRVTPATQHLAPYLPY
jgi:hypothetical protein